MTDGITSLLLVLTPIALFDSTSITPLCIVPLIMLLSGDQPIFRASAFLFGIFIAYLASSLLVVWGLQSVFEKLNEFFSEKLKNPDALDLVLQIAIGACMVCFGSRMANARESRENRGPQESISATKAFLGGAGLTLIGMPGAFPLFAAVDQVLRADPNAAGTVVAMLFYNVLFILPLCLVVVIRLWLGERSVPLLTRINTLVMDWGRRIVVWGLIIAGTVLVLDGFGWFMGRPLLPV